MSSLAFLKLGGSLITEKAQPSTARHKLIRRLAGEIAQARDKDPNLRLVLGHGSGSFGHMAARNHGTRTGVKSAEDWHGFAEVYSAAAALNKIIMQALEQCEVRAIAFPPSASLLAREGQIESWELKPIAHALEAGLLPVVYGDVAFDLQRGGSIISTEELFSFLTAEFQPTHILLAGEVAGVFADFPQQASLINNITPQSFGDFRAAIAGSVQTDVTGGMLSKVEAMLQLVQSAPGLEVRIFSGKEPGAILKAIEGDELGTRIGRE